MSAEETLRRALNESQRQAHALSVAILGPGARLDWFNEALSEATRLRADNERLREDLERQERVTIARARQLREARADNERLRAKLARQRFFCPECGAAVFPHASPAASPGEQG